MRPGWSFALVILVAVAGCAVTDLPSPSASAQIPSAPTISPTPAGSAATASPRPTPPPATPSPAAPSPPALTPTPSPGRVGYLEIASGLGRLTLLTHAGDGSGRIYLVDQDGLIHVGDTNGTFAAQPFLDVSDRVRAGGEQGLLGLAFHPGYAENGRFFVDYSDADGHNVIAEYHRDDGTPPGADPRAAPDSERVLLRIEQPFSNHNGGMLAFGPDGMLYISSGDGGSAGDPLNSGQDTASLLGKILRIDVDAAVDAPYAIPADNPFADGRSGARPEIWSFGLRNPWRFSFDRQTGAMFIGDVGQNRWEEINVEPAGVGGRNYGWRMMEGPDCFVPANCDPAPLALPVAWYPTSRGCAVTGGYVYRGAAQPALDGAYFYADYCSGDVWTLDAAAALSGQQVAVELLPNSGIRITGFGEDEAGEIYVVGRGGEVLRLIAGN